MDKYGFKLYALCILSNHVHYLIEPAAHQDLPKIMHFLNWYTAMCCILNIESYWTFLLEAISSRTELITQCHCVVVSLPVGYVAFAERLQELRNEAITRAGIASLVYQRLRQRDALRSLLLCSQSVSKSWSTLGSQ
ncbi:transposase [Nostoc sp.]|uniref:transposase n=1 Tax=Nostoc sp. TaxID=1180 RepID=UPI002FF5E53C